MKSRPSQSTVYQLAFLALIGALVLTACNLPIASSAVPSGNDQNQSLATPASPGTITITASDPCSVVTRDQVKAAFGKDVQDGTPVAVLGGSECQYSFGTPDTHFDVVFYEGDAAQQYFAGLTAAAGQSCDAFLTAAVNPAMPDSSSTAAQTLLGSDVSSLYRQYLDSMKQCTYVHSQNRPDVGDNVLASESIFLGWGSDVAILDSDRVVEFAYQEPIPQDVMDALAQGSDRDSLYKLADPYRQQVLSGYTDSLIKLVQQAATK